MKIFKIIITDKKIKKLITCIFYLLYLLNTHHDVLVDLNRISLLFVQNAVGTIEQIHLLISLTFFWGSIQSLGRELHVLLQSIGLYYTTFHNHLRPFGFFYSQRDFRTELFRKLPHRNGYKAYF